MDQVELLTRKHRNTHFVREVKGLKNRTAKLSEVGGCVLGVIWANEPCTPYYVRKVFSDSPNPYWSGSAGTIYPLVVTLEKNGLIRSSKLLTGRRRSKQYSLTQAGFESLRHWLRAMPDWVVAVPPDPLRTRLEFLGALPKKQRAQFLEEARSKMRSHLHDVEEYSASVRTGDDKHPFLASRGTLRTAKARLQWIGEVLSELEER